MLPLALILAVIVVPSASADTVTLAVAKDNTLYEDTAGALSNGAGSYLFTGKTLFTADLRRALIQFDIAGNIPAGSRVTGVALTMNMSRTISAAQPTSLHRALADWGEGASDALGQEGGGTTALPGDATWVYTFFPTTLWASIGGDYSAVASATIDVAGLGSYTWGSTDGMVADVQSWLDDPAQNFGWLIAGNETMNGTAKRFDSRENMIAGNRPSLTVTYCPPTSPASWANYGAGWPGTGGIPSLTASNAPRMCEPVTISIGNSLGAGTLGGVFIGFAQAALPTAWDGTLLVDQVLFTVLPIPAAGLPVPFLSPCDDAFCGVAIYLQVLMQDPGASQGVAFTPGLELVFGS